MAAFGLLAVACIHLPARVCLKKSASAAMTAITASSTTSCCDMIMMLPNWMGSGETMGGKAR